jgi:hypothetical protein
MYVSLLAPEQFEGFHSQTPFNNSSVMGRFMLNANVLTPDTEAAKMGATENAIFSKTTIMGSITFQLFVSLVRTIVNHRFSNRSGPGSKTGHVIWDL